MKIEGGCLCGKVRYSADAEPAFVGVCHCKNCQKGTGTAFSVVVGIPSQAPAERHNDLGRYARRRELGQAGNGDLLRQRAALG